MRGPSRLAAAVLALASAALVIHCTRGGSPAAPAALDLVLDYAGPVGINLPPATDNTCADHWAPVNLEVSTDWVFSAPLEPRANGHYGTTLTSVPAGSHWVALYDTRLCPLDPLAPPIATVGITFGGVALSRETRTPGGGRAIAFTVDAFGRVRP